MLVGIAGRERLAEKRVTFQEEDLKEMASRFNLPFLESLPAVSAGQALGAILGPSPEPFWKTACKGACQEIFFLNTLESAPQFADVMLSLASSHGYPPGDIAAYIQPVHQGASCHIEFDLPFDRQDPKEAARVKRFYAEASRALAEKGAYYSRPYGMWTELAFNRDAASARVIEKIKGIFDPNNVMNPGKLGF